MGSSMSEHLEDKRPLNQLHFALKDYPSIFDSLLARIREQYGDEYNDFASSSIGVMLVNLMAYSTSQLSWYLDRQASDTYLSTARSLDAVTRLAEQIGYKPKPASASTVDLQLEFEATPFEAVLKKGFRFRGPSNLTFYTTSESVVPVGATSLTVNASEGEERELTFVSTGAENQSVQIGGIVEGSYVADKSVRVFINGREWEEKDFLTFDKTDHFEVTYTSSPPVVRFGDGFAGNIPTKGTTIRVVYRVIRGPSGNVRSSTINSAIDTFLVQGEPTPFTSVNNAREASGGAFPETIQSIKKYAPQVFQSRGSAVTQNDYNALVNSFSSPTYGSVSKGYASVPRDVGADHTVSTMIYNFILNEIESIASVTSLTSDLSSVDSSTRANVGTANDLQTEIISNASVSENGLDQISNLCPQISNNANEVISGMNTNYDKLSEIRETIDNSTGLSNKLETLELIDDVMAICASAKLKASNVEGLSSQIRGSATSLVSSVQSISQGATSSASSLSTALNEQASVAGLLNSILTELSSMKSKNESNRSDLITQLNLFYSSDCNANVVRVPVLVNGPDGFYRAPSTGLIKALQGYLDSIKEVTHHVVVESGEHGLVYADLDLDVKINTSYVSSEIRQNIESLVSNLLKGRDFNQNLYLSTIYELVEAIDGVDYVNIEIVSPVEKLVNGNLVVNELEVITKGTLTVREVS